jgi:hypothetical protein
MIITGTYSTVGAVETQTVSKLASNGHSPASDAKSTDMTHVTVTFSGTHEFLCRSKLNSFDDHGMCATPCRTVLFMATATVELDQIRTWQPASSVSADVKQ